MYNSFYYSAKTVIQFGENSIEKLSTYNHFENMLVLYGGSYVDDLGIIDSIKKQLTDVELIIESDCKQNPSSNDVAQILERVKPKNIQGIIAVGGGSVIDLAKAIGLTYFCETTDFVENVGKKAFTKALPIITIVTNPSSGSEANNTLVITDSVTKNKIALGNGLIAPELAIYDHNYMSTLSFKQISVCTADILSHLLEQYFSSDDSTYFVDNLILGSIKSLIRSYTELKNDIMDISAKQNFMLTASYSLSYLFSIGRTMDWNVHTIEHWISGRYGTSHGIGVSIIYPRYLKYAISNDVYKEKLSVLNDVVFQSQDSDILSPITKFYSEFGLPQNFSELSKDINVYDVLSAVSENKNVLYGRNYQMDIDIIEKILNDCK